MKRIEAVNDFVIRFANVNGSGSASANNMFAKAIFRMGLPCSPKNIFPSNIQGLPTWYEVRVSEDGYLSRRGGVDMAVAVNSQTMRQDYDDLSAGGYYFYDSSRDLPRDFERDDVQLIGVPLTTICNEAIQEPRLRQLLKNIIYVGALAYLLEIEFAVLTDSVKHQFRKKPKLAEPNIQALELGFNYAKENLAGTCGLSVQRRSLIGDRIMCTGNTGAALGAIYGGATVAGWYPITPSTSVAEDFERYANRLRLDDEGRKKAAVIQAEDELAALGIVIGAAWNGARAFTATSGPGISLMNEFLGLAYFAEIPAVLIDVQRAGPSTGMPTRTQQSDILLCAYASHGDTRNVLLFPADPRECFDMTADALDLADRLQTPVIVMSDLDLGMNDHLSPPFSWDDTRRYDRGKVLSAAELDGLRERWGRYLDVDGDGICYRTYPGTHPEKGAYFTRGTSHNEYSAYTEYSIIYERNMQRLMTKWETAKTLVPPPLEQVVEASARVGFIYYGTTAPAAQEVMDRLAAKGLAVNSLRILAFPFSPQVRDFIDRHDLVLVIEQNRDGQMRMLLHNELGIAPARMISVVCYDGMVISSRELQEKVEAVLADHGMLANRIGQGE